MSDAIRRWTTCLELARGVRIPVIFALGNSYLGRCLLWFIFSSGVTSFCLLMLEFLTVSHIVPVDVAVRAVLLAMVGLGFVGLINLSGFCLLLAPASISPHFGKKKAVALEPDLPIQHCSSSMICIFMLCELA